MFGMILIPLFVLLLLGVGAVRMTSYRYLSLAKAGAELSARLPREQAQILQHRLERLRAFRQVGGLAGVVTVAVALVILRHSLTISLVALIAGVSGGSVIAEYLRSRPDPRTVRTATLHRRTVSSQVGRPLWLMLGLAGAADVVMTLVAAIYANHHGRVLSWTYLPGGSCQEDLARPAVAGSALAEFAIPLVLLGIGLAAAASATRRPDDLQLPIVIDNELRSATIRFGLGGPATLAWLGAATSTGSLASQLDEGCTSARFSLGAALLYVLAFGFALLAFNCFVRYLLRPIRPLKPAETATPIQPGRVSPAG